MPGASLAALLLSLPATSDVPVIIPDQARDYVGREVVVQGQVAQVGVSEDGDTLFLNLGGRYPDHVFNAVIFEDNLNTFAEARSWEGKNIKVGGTIQLYKGKGKPEIILERREQVTIDSGTTHPQGAAREGEESGVEGGVLYGVPRGGQGGALGGTGTGQGLVMDYDSPPRPVKITRPTYPAEAFARRIEGTVVVEILIDSQGRVVRARVIQSVPQLDAAALYTVYQWAFQPAIKNGRPVPTIAHAPVAFRIYEREHPGKQEQRKQRPAEKLDQ
jgi:TonB family protein